MPLSQFLSSSKKPLAGTPSLLRKGSILQLSPTQCHYVISVMRMVGPGRKKGRWRYEEYDPCVRVFDGSSTAIDKEWVAQLEVMDDLGSSSSSSGDNEGGTKKRQKNNRRRTSKAESATVVAQCLAPVGRSSTPKTTTATSLVPILCFAPPKKKDRYQWILEKGTELGMEAWLLLQTDRTESSSSRDYERKGQAYVLEAAEQCERTSIPPLLSLAPPVDDNDSDDDDASAGRLKDMLMQDDNTPSLSRLSSLLTMLSKDEFGHEHNLSVLLCRERSSSSTPLLEALQQIQTSTRSNANTVTGIDNGQQQFCMVLIGPEGGWSPEEEAAFDKLSEKKPSVIWNISLGSNVLRTDTAAVTAVAAFALFHQDS